MLPGWDPGPHTCQANGYSPEQIETLLVYAFKLWHSHHTELPVLQLPRTNMLLNSQVCVVHLALYLYEET